MGTGPAPSLSVSLSAAFTEQPELISSFSLAKTWSHYLKNQHNPAVERPNSWLLTKCEGPGLLKTIMCSLNGQ